MKPAQRNTPEAWRPWPVTFGKRVEWLTLEEAADENAARLSRMDSGALKDYEVAPGATYRRFLETMRDSYAFFLAHKRKEETEHKAFREEADKALAKRYPDMRKGKRAPKVIGANLLPKVTLGMKLMAEGFSMSKAAKFSGISYSTLLRWKIKGV